MIEAREDKYIGTPWNQEKATSLKDAAAFQINDTRFNKEHSLDRTTSTQVLKRLNRTMMPQHKAEKASCRNENVSPTTTEGACQWDLLKKCLPNAGKDLRYTHNDQRRQANLSRESEDSCKCNSTDRPREHHKPKQRDPLTRRATTTPHTDKLPTLKQNPSPHRPTKVQKKHRKKTYRHARTTAPGITVSTGHH